MLRDCEEDSLLKSDRKVLQEKVTESTNAQDRGQLGELCEEQPNSGREPLVW